ncbi:prolyl 3-hydroxylase 1 [Lampris incognitus]|uniref:prolyl 3-hydroxylase 1 n=1 Tax=Lampris incognitus TaxID=2546036 RepID=UPI0024B59092|nr:prolyl 3-hydroxylase 1 [Lampris incognitus]
MGTRYARVFLCLIPICMSQIQFSSHATLEPYDLLFDSAVEAYYKADWISVILNMEKAIRNKAAVRKVKTECRITCANRTAFSEPLYGYGPPIPGAGAVEDLGFFQQILKRADCVKSCENEKLGPSTLHKVGEEVELEFTKRTPYNYLQVAYFKINKLDKAVAAANTFFLANPDHLEMKQNLDYYRMMAGVNEEDFKDLEAQPHMAEFLLGKRYYSDDSFGLAAGHFELTAEEYFVADRECRVLCEGAHDYDGYNYMEYKADLFQSMTDHYMQVLNCQQRCAVELASTAGRSKPFENFLPSLFNYLQFSYYNSEKYKQAIECAKTFLLFHPKDEVMNQNLAYYSVVFGEDKAEGVSPREVVKRYIQQSLLEKELLYFGYEVFGITFVDPDTWTPEDIMPQKLREKQKADRETAARITEEIGNLMKEIETLVEEKNKDSSDLAKLITEPESGPLLYDDIKITMMSKQLNGSNRVLLDGVISDDECRELYHLSNAAALKGDGYRGRPSPHSPNEMFQGVTVLKAVKLGQEGKVPLKSARLFFDLSEKVRKIVESFFHLNTTLYFSYSHLVCRSAIEEKQEEREDLSHPVHVDNCLLISELNECIKEPPAYTHRDYSAILYLNGDFEGGDFIFTELDAKTITAEVRPKCGRVVGFGSGKENPHGVRAVTKGQRCAVALWFTLDPAHEEKERIEAQEMLKMFSTPLNEEFSKTEAKDTSESQRTPSDHESAQMSADKTNEKPAKKPEKSASTKVETPPADAPKDKAADKAASKKTATKVKTAPKAKAKAGDQAKAKTADKVKSKPTAKTVGKQTVKTKTKQTDKKDAKPVTKKTAQSSVEKESRDPKTDTASESQKDKDEL